MNLHSIIFILKPYDLKTVFIQILFTFYYIYIKTYSSILRWSNTFIYILLYLY